MHNIGYGYKNTKNQGWNLTGFTECLHRKAATEELCNVTTNKIEIEVLDGILLNLNIRSKMKPSKVQDRILRRIVEKRQAQASHKKHGRSEDLTSMHITLACTSKCMKDIRKKRYAA